MNVIAPRGGEKTELENRGEYRMFDKWDKRFIEMAQLVGTWSSCFQENRKIGAVIVKDRRIMTTGYNGAPSGVRSCVLYAPEDKRWDDFYGFNRGGRWPVSFAAMIGGAAFACVLLWVVGR